MATDREFTAAEETWDARMDRVLRMDVPVLGASKSVDPELVDLGSAVVERDRPGPFDIPEDRQVQCRPIEPDHPRCVRDEADLLCERELLWMDDAGPVGSEPSLEPALAERRAEVLR